MKLAGSKLRGRRFSDGPSLRGERPGPAGLQLPRPAVASNRGSGSVGCKTEPFHRGGFGALAALSRRCRALAAGPAWARGPLGPSRLRSGPGAERVFPRRGAPPSLRSRVPHLNLDSLFPLFCRLASGVMAQRAFPNPYADYNKSLAEAYFDSAGRVSSGYICLHPYPHRKAA